MYYSTVQLGKSAITLMVSKEEDGIRAFWYGVGDGPRSFWYGTTHAPAMAEEG